jgi:molybdopterin converting factor small subunit
MKGKVMSQTVIIPTPLRRFTNGVEIAQVQGRTISEIFDQLEVQFPGIRARLCEDNGELRRFINVYVDGEDIRFLNRLETNVDEKAEVSIVPAIAGG